MRGYLTGSLSVGIFVQRKSWNILNVISTLICENGERFEYTVAFTNKKLSHVLKVGQERREITGGWWGVSGCGTICQMERAQRAERARERERERAPQQNTLLCLLTN